VARERKVNTDETEGIYLETPRANELEEAEILEYLWVKGCRSHIETSDIEAMTHMVQDAFVIIVVDDSTLFFAEAITKVNHVSITNAQDLIVDLL